MQIKNLALYALPGFRIKAAKSTEAEVRMVNRKNAYWFSQLTGWTVFAIINLIVTALFDKLTAEEGILLIFLSFAGIGFTHLLREIIRKYNWVDLQLSRLIPRILIGSLSFGAFIFVIYFSASYLANTLSPQRASFGNFMLGLFNMSSVVLFWTLIYFAVHYFENYKKAEIEALVWENAVKEFELRTLKSQLNPHFMFNAMNSIRALIKEEPQSAQTAVTKLSNILRYSLKIERNETVPLEEEIETVADYLSLETIRFEERLKYKINVEPSTAKIEIPPMMVQTLVENGIKHGISRIKEGGEISIGSYQQNGKLHIQIRNTGTFDPESLKHTSGFGIQNTKHRLSLLYGENARLTIENENNKTVLAEIEIPSGGINK